MEGKAETKEPQNLMEGLFAQMNRVREMMALYRTIPMGFIAADLMQLALNRAQRSIEQNDVVAMLQSYAELEAYED